MAYANLVILAQSVLRVAIVETTEGVSLGKTKGRGRLFVFSVIDVILATQLNAISSGYLPSI
jgi:hypothetical protein